MRQLRLPVLPECTVFRRCLRCGGPLVRDRGRARCFAMLERSRADALGYQACSCQAKYRVASVHSRRALLGGIPPVWWSRPRRLWFCGWLTTSIGRPTDRVPTPLVKKPGSIQGLAIVMAEDWRCHHAAPREPYAIGLELGSHLGGGFCASAPGGVFLFEPRGVPVGDELRYPLGLDPRKAGLAPAFEVDGLEDV